jgi:hypothetical protein
MSDNDLTIMNKIYNKILDNTDLLKLEEIGKSLSRRLRDEIEHNFSSKEEKEISFNLLLESLKNEMILRLMMGIVFI